MACEGAGIWTKLHSFSSPMKLLHISMALFDKTFSRAWFHFERIENKRNKSLLYCLDIYHWRASGSFMETKLEKIGHLKSSYLFKIHEHITETVHQTMTISHFLFTLSNQNICIIVKYS